MANSRIIELAIKGLEAERARIDQELQDLRSQQSGTHSTTPSSTSKTKSATVPVVKSSAKRKGGISAAGRARLSEMAKKRWAKSRKLGKKTL